MLRAARLILAIVFAWSAYQSLRFADAAYLAQDHSLPTTNAALRLTPHDPNLHLQLAHAFLASKAPDLSVQAALTQALDLNPANSTLWLEAAATSEQLRDYPTAETQFLHAVHIDRTFAPRWLLAEFYARRHNLDAFWPAMRAALATSYDDVTPLFETCWNLTPNPAVILPLAIPARPDVLTQYLDFLLTKNRLDLAQPVAAHLLLKPTKQTQPTLLAYADRLLWNNQPIPARQIWDALSTTRLIPYPVGALLTNPAFEKPFLQQAFDWRLSAAPGITAQQETSPPLLRFECNGKQTEHAELASQFLQLHSNQAYRLTISYQNEIDVAALIPGITRTPDTGFHFHLIPAATQLDLLTSSPLQGPDRQLQTRTYSFTTPPATNLFRLILTYDRTYGTIRFEGAVTLFQTQLTPA